MPPIEARKSSPSTFSGRPPGPGPEVGPILRILGQALTVRSGAIRDTLAGEVVGGGTIWTAVGFAAVLRPLLSAGPGNSLGQ